MDYESLAYRVLARGGDASLYAEHAESLQLAEIMMALAARDARLWPIIEDTMHRALPLLDSPAEHPPEPLAVLLALAMWYRGDQPAAAAIIAGCRRHTFARPHEFWLAYVLEKSFELGKQWEDIHRAIMKVARLSIVA